MVRTSRRKSILRQRVLGGPAAQWWLGEDAPWLRALRWRVANDMPWEDWRNGV